MQLNLDEQDVAALITALNDYIPRLREEIGKTEKYDMRQELKSQEGVLTALIAKLGGSISSTNMPDVGAKNPPWGGGR